MNGKAVKIVKGLGFGALLVAVSANVAAQDLHQAYCESVANIAYYAKQAKDKGIPEAKLVRTLVENNAYTEDGLNVIDLAYAKKYQRIKPGEFSEITKTACEYFKWGE